MTRQVIDDDQIKALLAEAGNEESELDDAALDALAEAGEAIARAESLEETEPGETGRSDPGGSPQSGAPEGLTNGTAVFEPAALLDGIKEQVVRQAQSQGFQGGAIQSRRSAY